MVDRYDEELVASLGNERMGGTRYLKLAATRACLVGALSIMPEEFACLRGIGEVDETCLAWRPDILLVWLWIVA
ncbi:hypothetical protein DAI22_02g094800 [Oryza sativa Japonica Group]|nr:hypothetical protein DAI22_02g094800 [Oryza sativa Japonica Group]